MAAVGAGGFAKHIFITGQCHSSCPRHLLRHALLETLGDGLLRWEYLHQPQAKHLRRGRLAGAVMALRAGGMLHAWRAWVDHVASTLHKKQLLRVAAGHLANHHAHAAFSTWQVTPP
jgi:hypothetical protein